jgi:hypothetical protein
MPERFDLNTARVREMAELPGIDPLLARRIALDRRIYGPFDGLRDLARVPGVTPRVMALLEERGGIDALGGEPASRSIVIEALDRRGPLLFAGPPTGVRGSFVLRNLGDHVVRGLRMRIERTTLRRPDGGPLTELVADAFLRAGEHARVSVSLRIDPFTAPGQYEAELVVGEHRYAALIVVAARLATVLSPALVLLSPRHHVAETQVLVRNEGNLPLKIDNIGPVVLEQSELECLVIRDTVHRLKHPTWDELVGTASDELKKHLDLKPLGVRTLNKPVEVHPGAYALMLLEVTVPRELPRHRVLFGSVLIGDAPLVFQLSWSLGHLE